MLGAGQRAHAALLQKRFCVIICELDAHTVHLVGKAYRSGGPAGRVVAATRLKASTLCRAHPPTCLHWSTHPFQVLQAQ